MAVSYVNTRHYDHKCYTRLRLNGTWMEEAGFTTGTKIDIRVMPGCLVITARPTDTPLIQLLNKTKELPESEQQHVMAFLQVMIARVELEKL